MGLDIPPYLQHLEQEGVVLPNLSGFGKKIPYMVTLLVANLSVFGCVILQEKLDLKKQQ